MTVASQSLRGRDALRQIMTGSQFSIITFIVERKVNRYCSGVTRRLMDYGVNVNWRLSQGNWIVYTLLQLNFNFYIELIIKKHIEFPKDDRHFLV